VRPQRLETDDGKANKDSEPDVAQSATTGEKDVEHADPPATETQEAVDPSAQVIVEPAQRDAKKRRAGKKSGGITLKGEPVSELTGPTKTPRGGVGPERAVVIAKPVLERRTRSKVVKSVTLVSTTSPATRSAADEIILADEEIRQLRLELADKVRLQNLQLRKMLERFER
jgi:hypothetical protein